MRRSLVVAFVLSLIMAPLSVAMASDRTELRIVSLSRNVTYSHSRGGDKYFVAGIDTLTELKVVLAHGKVDGPRETVQSMCRRYHCLVGINGDFFGGPGPHGAVVISGHILRTAYSQRAQIWISKSLIFQASPPPALIGLSLGSKQIALSTESGYEYQYGFNLYLCVRGRAESSLGRIDCGVPVFMSLVVPTTMAPPTECARSGSLLQD